AALGNDVDHAAQGAAMFGFEAARLDLNLLNELHLEIFTDTAVEDVGGVHAIDQVDVLSVAGPIHLKAVGAPAGALQGLLARAGSEGDERLEGAAFGNVLQDVRLHRYSHLALGGVQEDGPFCDLHCFRHRANFQLHVDNGQAAGTQLNAALLV